MNTQAWLTAQQRPGAPDGPTRGEYLPERLEPGDVGEDGSIALKCGRRDPVGPVWVGEDQAIRASYYGWEIDSSHLGPVMVECDGTDRLWRIVNKNRGSACI